MRKCIRCDELTRSRYGVCSRRACKAAYDRIRYGTNERVRSRKQKRMREYMAAVRAAR